MASGINPVVRDRAEIRSAKMSVIHEKTKVYINADQKIKSKNQKRGKRRFKIKLHIV